ncbi:MAG: nucleoside triphosphate pyrophosphohydrolase [Candidatus Latescibacterota bacterium]|nr:MAG: nucleoside triphosphate pyrophosphohydrolase [Candidatus Latescibacterota bacterium]
MEEFGRLVEVVARLRRECPWDRKQTHESIRPYLIEEAYEVAEAIGSGDDGELKEELGDLLLQVVFHARMAEERGAFSVGDVVKGLVEKLVRRHPHVFGEVEVEDAEEVLERWEEIKKKEGRESLLDGVPRSLPALLRARRVQEKASKVGFDWERAEGALGKLGEELGELEDAMRSGDRVRAEEELGDLLFSVVNLSRFLGLDPEWALHKAIDKFVARFKKVEEELAERGKDPREATLEEMDRIWDETKAGG